MYYLRPFEYIVGVYEEGTFSAAAKKLGIAQSSLSSTVQKIEDELGYVLFDRSTSPISVTKAGELYIRNARLMLINHHQILSRINDEYDSVNNNVTIGMAPTKSYFLTPLLYKQLNTKYPGIKLTVAEKQTSQLLGMLLKGEVDLVYTTDKIYDPDLFNVQKVCGERMTLATRKNGHYSQLCHVAFDNSHLDMKCLKEAMFIGFEKEQLLTKDMKKIFDRLSFTPNVSIRVSSLLTALPLVKEDLGIMFLPSCYTHYSELSDFLDFYYFDSDIYSKDQVILTRKKQYITKQLGESIQIIKNIT